MAKKAVKAAKSGEKAKTGAKKLAGAKRTAVSAVHKPARRAPQRKAGTAPARSAASSVVEDQLAIQQLLHKYCHVVDRGTVDEIANLFHRDAVLLPAYESDERYVGRNDVRGWYENYDKTLRSEVRYLRHKIESPVVEVSGNEATSVCYLDADAITIATDEPMIVFGRYDDKLIKDQGRWWFKERKIIVYYSHAVAKYTPGRGE